MFEQAIVIVIVAAAAVYAVRSIMRSARGGGDDHCSDCSLKDAHARKDPAENTAPDTRRD